MARAVEADAAAAFVDGVRTAGRARARRPTALRFIRAEFNRGGAAFSGAWNVFNSKARAVEGSSACVQRRTMHALVIAVRRCALAVCLSLVVLSLVVNGIGCVCIRVSLLLSFCCRCV